MDETQSSTQQPPSTQPLPPQTETTPPISPQPSTPVQTPVSSQTTPSDAPSSSSTTSQTPPPPPKPESIPSTPPNSPEFVKHHVSLRTMFLILLLALLAGVLLFVALSQNKPRPVATKIIPTPTASPAHSTLTMTLDTNSTSSGSLASKMVDVNVETASNKVEGVQFEVSYDPTVLTNVTVRPGTFFPNPLTLLNNVDSKNGKINFAVGIQPTAQPMVGSGTVAVISYTLLPTKFASQTTLKFLPKTQVVGQGILGSVLEKALDITIPVAGLSPAVSTSTSSAK